MTDSVIIKGIHEKDNRVLSELYKRNLPNVRKFVLNNSGNEDDANDILQEGIILIYQKIKNNSLQITVSVEAYLLATCKNIWLMRLRRTKKMIVDSEQVENSGAFEENLIFDLIRAEKYTLYRKHFLKMERGCQSIMNQVFSGKSMKEIAEDMNISVGYARKKKFMCKEKLLRDIQNDEAFNELKSHKSVI